MTDAMQQQPDVFDPLCLSMVHVGEHSGNLEHVLSILADFSGASNSSANKPSACRNPAYRDFIQ